MEFYSIIVLSFAALVLLSALYLVRRQQKRIQTALATQEDKQIKFEPFELTRVQNPTEQDHQAYKLIESERHQVWSNLTTNTSLTPRKIYHRSFDLIQRIAAIYYPDVETPEFQASIFDLLELNYRITERVKDALDEFPLNTIKEVNIQDILKMKGYWDKLSQMDLVKFAKEHKYFYSVGRYAWMGYNALNPWYWGRKAVSKVGKEGTFRYLLSVVITIVGEEAVLVYSKRNLKARAVAMEKSIAFEMINMAVIDGVVTQEEYDTILTFILKNAKLDDQMKVALLTALQHKQPVKGVALPEDEKEKKRLLMHVERVAKADKLGLLKKRDALKRLEDALQLESTYRAQLELAPHEEVQSWDLMQQNRLREEAILRLMAQAGSVESDLPDTLRDYIIQRAAGYPLPFSKQEQDDILQETMTPTALDLLTNLVVTRADKERALSEILDALLWRLPFSRAQEEFYIQSVTALDMKKTGEKLLFKRLENLLPPGKLIEKPPVEVLHYLYRLLDSDEQICALQETNTKYTFCTNEATPKQKDTPYWLCVTDSRILTLASTTIDSTLYQHHLQFDRPLKIDILPGKVYDTYVLNNGQEELHLENTLFRGASLKNALQAFLPQERAALPEQSTEGNA